MTQHIKNLSLSILLVIFISCKKENNSKLYVTDKNIISNETNIIKDKDNSNYKVWHSNSNNDENYIGVKILISNDSILVVKDNETVCKGEIIKEKQTFIEYFKSAKTGLEIKKRFEKEFDLNVKDTLTVIMNAYGDVSEKGCQFPFNDMFIIDNHLFLFDKKYQCFLPSKSSQIIVKSKVNNSINESKIKLPYNKKIDINNVKYEIINVDNIIGLREFSCDENKARYIALPSRDNVSLRLVPQDCADFPYRFYLLVIKDNKVISNLYVEGKWFEPENYNEIETTSFSIDDDYNIKVITEKNKNINIDNYTINTSGNIIKQ